jgi:hypothetical protein
LRNQFLLPDRKRHVELKPPPPTDVQSNVPGKSGLTLRTEEKMAGQSGMYASIV